MNATLFFFTLIAAVVWAFWYVNKGDFAMPKEEYCRQIEAARTEDGDYQMSYGDRAKGVVRGCF